MKALLGGFAIATLCFSMVLLTGRSAENPGSLRRQVDWRHDIRALVTPGGRTIFVVTNFDKVILEASRSNATNAPEIVYFDSPEKLFEAVEHLRTMPGFISYGQGWKCPNYCNVAGMIGGCTQDGTNYARTVFYDYAVCEVGSTNDYCAEGSAQTGITKHYTNYDDCNADRNYTTTPIYGVCCKVCAPK